MNKTLYSLTIPSFKVTNPLQNFPILVNLGDSSGLNNLNVENIFNHFTYPENVDYDFIGNDGDSPNEFLWFNLGDGRILNNKLNVNTGVVNNVGTLTTSMETKYQISGDFDFEVNFNDITATGESSIYFSFIDYVSDSRFHLIRDLNRVAEEDFRVVSSAIDYSDYTTVKSTDSTTNFKLRMVRTGTVLKSYYDNGSGWEWIGNTDGYTHPRSSSGDINLIIGLGRYSDVDSGELICDTDNFKLNSGTVVWNDEDLPDLSSFQITQPIPYNEYITSLIPLSYYRFAETVNVISAKYWRLTVTKDNGANAYTALTRVRLLNENGNDLTVPVASGSLATASTTYSGTYSPSNSFDDNISTFWHSSEGMPQWIKYDTNGLATIAPVTLELNIRDQDPTRNPQDFILEYSNDDTNWTTVLTVVGETVWDTLFKTYTLSPSGSKDEIGSLNGTYVNSPTLGVDGLLEDDINTSITLNGVNQYIDYGDNFNLGLNDMSVVISFKTNQYIDQGLITKSLDGGLDGRWWCNIKANGNINFGIDKNATAYTYIATTNYSIDTIHHLVIVLDRDGNITFYLDGVLSGTFDISSHSTHDFQTNISCKVGAYTEADGTTPNLFFDGTIDDFAIFNKTLSVDEIIKIYQSSIGNFQNKSLSVEIDRWDYINKQAQLWTKIPYIPNDSDTVLSIIKLEPDDFSTYVKSLTPLVYWRLGESVGESVAIDEMELFNGNYIGIPTLETQGLLIDDSNTAVYFDGVDGKCVKSDGIIPANTLYTISMLVKINDDTNQINFIHLGDDSVNSQQGLRIYYNNTSGITFRWSDGSWHSISSNILLDLDKIYHIVICRVSTTEWDLYVNNSKTALSGDTINITGSQPVYIGCEKCNTTYCSNDYVNVMNGTIDEVALFDKLLTEEEISQMYKNSVAHINNPDIGTTGTSQAQDVWTEYDNVYHLSKDGTDSTANVLNGAMNNMDATNIVDFGVGKGLTFNGTDEYIATQNINIIGSEARTLECNVKMITNSSDVSAMVGWGTVSNSNKTSYIVPNISSSPQWGFWGYGTDGDQDIYSGNIPTINELTNIVYSFDGVDGVLYKNNVNIGTNSTLTLDSDNAQLMIGKNNTTGNESFINAEMAEIRISRDSKSSSWIEFNYGSTSDNLMNFVSLLTKNINGTILESYKISEWIARAWMVSDGSLTKELITSSTTFALEIPIDKDYPHIVTVSPNIGDTWKSETAYIIDDLVYPTDPQTTHFYYKCIVAGNSGEIEPTWTTGDLDQIIDNTVTWELVEGIIQPITHYPVMPV